MNTTVLRPAVFLDRDGTIVEEIDYLSRPEQLRLIPGAAAAIRRLNERDMAVVVVTNQSGVARGKFSEQDLAAVHGRLKKLLAAESAHLDAIYYCPHLPEGGRAPYDRVCDCRKPGPGMLLQAAHDLNLDLAASAMVGDSLRDLKAGFAAGCRTLVLVRTGYGAAEESGLSRLSFPVQVRDDLAAALAVLPQV